MRGADGRGRCGKPVQRHWLVAGKKLPPEAALNIEKKPLSHPSVGQASSVKHKHAKPRNRTTPASMITAHMQTPWLLRKTP